jgi:hypothetical protein
MEEFFHVTIELKTSHIINEQMILCIRICKLLSLTAE